MLTGVATSAPASNGAQFDLEHGERCHTRRSRAALRVRRLYDHAAPRYDSYRVGWLRAAGASAESALLADLAHTVRSGHRVLDAGSGTGAVSRHLRELVPAANITMVDFSARMLARAVIAGAPRTVGSVLELPFPDNTFDVVVSAWVIETVPDPHAVVVELLRVLAPGGRLFYTFCSRPVSWLALVRSLALRTVVRWSFAGRFLGSKRTPWHECAASHRARFHGGLTTEIALAKCCTVRDIDAPAIGCKP